MILVCHTVSQVKNNCLPEFSESLTESSGLAEQIYEERII